MTSLVEPIDVRFEGDKFFVDLSDGRTIGVPVSWFPVLEAATSKERGAFSLSSRGVHWDAIDEDISVQGLLEGRGDMTNRGKRMKATAAE
jgi:hypothetical protein